MHGPALSAVVIIALLVGAAIAFLGRARKPRIVGLRPKPLLTDNEKSFFGQLEHALPGHRVFPQVSFAAFLTEDAKLSRKARFALRAKFNRKIADFVVCDRETLQIIALVELDDRTHVASADRQRDELTQSAGYHTIRFQAKQKPTAAEIASLLRPLVTPAALTPSTAPADTRKLMQANGQHGNVLASSACAALSRWVSRWLQGSDHYV